VVLHHRSTGCISFKREKIDVKKQVGYQGCAQYLRRSVTHSRTMPSLLVSRENALSAGFVKEEDLFQLPGTGARRSSAFQN
jgi:hypothetical protein